MCASVLSCVCHTQLVSVIITAALYVVTKRFSQAVEQNRKSAILSHSRLTAACFERKHGATVARGADGGVGVVNAWRDGECPRHGLVPLPVSACVSPGREGTTNPPVNTRGDTYTCHSASLPH